MSNVGTDTVWLCAYYTWNLRCTLGPFVTSHHITVLHWVLCWSCPPKGDSLRVHNWPPLTGKETGSRRGSSQRVENIWNSLPERVFAGPSINFFKSYIGIYLAENRGLYKPFGFLKVQ
ncbi:hypothetical protein HOLleu_42022 [Holothuria leucospilota]|uniref:Uncharacterized protein n=1 Tax=Holothuria leucospilota TaxID=206669 RepID=A0A9Q0YK16_HOLLE|nr:hypothetical protein HOLleu_42022 [Holothuria leucospilota]